MKYGLAIENNMVSMFHVRKVTSIVLCLFSVFFYIECDLFHDEYTEELLIKPFSTGHVYSHFHFVTKWNVTSNSHFHLFPKLLGEILFKHHVQELHFSLTRGQWRYQSWGYPLVDSGPGLELWVWFQESTTNIDDHYLGLTNALSGLFCASLNFIDSTNTVSPKTSFRPHGITSKTYFENSTYLKYSTLPRETVCTENLTPWMKLLPCNTKVGLTTLLNANQIFNSNYHSFSVNIRPVCKTLSCTESSLEMSQSLSLVSDTFHFRNDKRDWSISKLYGRILVSSCPLAKFSKIYVDDTSKAQENFTLSPNPTEIIISSKGIEDYSFSVYDVQKYLSESDNKMLNIAVKYEHFMVQNIIAPPSIYAIRSVTGYGQEFGGLKCDIYNKDWKKAITVVYMEMIPWFLRTYLHTLKITNGNRNLQPLYLHYEPAVDRKKPSLLEIALVLPPNSATKISIQFEQTLLKWTEYPPDANHGFYVGSAVISTILPLSPNYTGFIQNGSTIYESFHTASLQHFKRIHTEPLLILLPTPDFSMPYNVICLTCTVIALAFGPIHNLTIKRLEIKDSSKSSIKSNLKAFLKTLWSKIRNSHSVTSNKKEKQH